MEIVVSGTRTAESSQRATVRTDVVTREEATRRGATNVAEALAGETALQVNPEAYGYLGRPSGVQMQGLDGDRVRVLEDGEPVFGDVGGVVDLSQLSLAGVERIEYVQGPMSALYGANALGGVINVISGPPRSPGLSLGYRGEARSRSDYFAETSLMHRDGDAWQSLDASYRTRASVPRTGGSGGTLGQEVPLPASRLLLPDWRNASIGARTGVRATRAITLRFKARFMRDESEGYATRTTTSTFFIDTQNQVNRGIAQAQSSVRLGKAANLDLSLRKTWYASRSEEFYRDSPVGTVRQRRLDAQSLEGILTLADGDRTWVFGLRNELQDYDQFTLESTPSLDRSSHATVDLFKYEVEPLTIYSGALYGQLAWRLFEGFTILSGVRAELHNRYRNVVAPKLGLAAELSENLSVRGSFGRGFRVPSSRELGFVFDHSNYGYAVLGNRELAPETSWGVTGDVTLRASDRVRIRAGAFMNWIQDLIDIDDPELGNPDLASAPTTFSSSGVSVYQYKNIARARTAGGDASIRVKLRDWLTAECGYAYLWTRDDSVGAPLPRRPSHSLTLSGNADLPLGLQAYVRYKVVSSPHGTVDDLPVEGSFALLDARVAFQPLPSIEAYVGGQNLGDVQRNPDNPNDLRPALGLTLYAGLRGQLPGEADGP